MIKAIPTEYKGCRFRSRTEARWAVFFDTLGVGWEYEKEGYDLPSGRYLPDFWIPEWKAWFEVKGESPTHHESTLAHELSEMTQRRVIIAIGIPEEDAGQFESAFILKLKLGETMNEMALYDRYKGSTWTLMPLPHRRVDPYSMEHADATPRIRAAIKAARSARFEHGEKP